MNAAFQSMNSSHEHNNYELYTRTAMPVPVAEDSDRDSNISSEDTASFSEFSNPQTPPLKGPADGVKQELRNAIKCRRVAKGLEEMPHLDAKRPKVEELSPAELEKRRIRRERNKLAAFKCRQRRKEHIQELEIESEGIEDSNKELEREISELHEQRQQLEEMLKTHSCKLSNNNGGSRTKSNSCASAAAKSNSGSPTTPTGPIKA
uniref:Fosb transcription factor-like protein n=1 Tax=Nematostella vectensis TaxID=45351 RepID=A0A1C9KCZ6_NEMVE|nr:fosb transcription factor-like protein [Nematostella vectensis]